MRIIAAYASMVVALASVSVAGCGSVQRDRHDAAADAPSGEIDAEAGDLVTDRGRDANAGDAVTAPDAADAQDAVTAPDAADAQDAATTDGASDTPPEDHTPPTVTSRIPAPGAPEVWVRDPIVVTFSEPISAATLTSTSVVISEAGGAPLARTLALSPDGTSLSITLALPAAVPGQLTATLTTAITDLAGNALVAPGPWSWTVPRWLTHGGGFECGTAPLLARDPHGHPVVAWSYCNNVLGLYVRRWNGSSWEVLDDPTFAFGLTSLAVAPDGGIFVTAELYSSGIPTGVQVWRGGDGSWQMFGPPVPTKVAVPAGELTGIPQVRVAPDGTVLLSWAEFIPSALIQKHVARWTGQAWESLGADSDPLLASGRAAIMSLDAAGTPYLVWKMNTGNLIEPVLAARWSGAAWQQIGGAQQANNCTCGDNYEPNYASMAVNAGGSVAAAWREAKVAGTQMFEWVHVWNGTGWRSLGDGLAGNMYYVEATSVGIDDAGGVVAAFIEDENVLGPGPAGMDIYVRSWNGSAWEVVDDRVGGAGLVQGIQLDLDGQGGTLMAWAQSDPSVGSMQIFVYRLNK